MAVGEVDAGRVRIKSRNQGFIISLAEGVAVPCFCFFADCSLIECSRVLFAFLPVGGFCLSPFWIVDCSLIEYSRLLSAFLLVGDVLF